MEEVTQSTVDDAFPHGVALFRSEDDPVVDMVGLEVREADGRVLALGWAWPNKDLLFDITAPKETDQGWWVKTFDGARVFWSPLSAARAEILENRLKEY